jgi:uncharacterized protein YukE
MAEEIYMDVPAVRNIASRFGEMGEHLQSVSKALEMAIATLKASAFVGMFGNQAYANYLEQVQPVIKASATKCAEMSSDLAKSVEAYERGDAAGATKFH